MTKLETRERFFCTGTGNSKYDYSFYCNKEAMSLLGKMVANGEVDKGTLIKELKNGSRYAVYTRIANTIGSTPAEVKSMFESDMDDALTLMVGQNGRTLRVAYKCQQSATMYYPVEGGTRRLAESVRDKIREAVNAAPGTDSEASVFENLYSLAIDFCYIGEQQGGETPERRDDVPAPKPDENGEPQVIERVIEKERVIERDVPNPLEQLLQKSLMDTMAKVAVDDMVPRIKTRLIDEFGFEPQVHQVKLVDKVTQFDGITHERFDDVLHFVANGIPTYLFGPAGTGKGVIGRQVAKALDLPYYFMNSITDEYKITGFMDAQGNYHETEFYKAFKDGGVFFLDELDASAPEVLVCLNMALADGMFAFPGETVWAHDDFRVIAAGNTLGTGADASYTGRMQLDAASLNRFVTIPIDYDERIDLMMADNDEELVRFAKQYRKSLKSCGLTGVCSYRNLKMIKVAAAKMPLNRALAFALTKEMNRDDINTMLGRGELDSSNKYTQALKKVTSLID